MQGWWFPACGFLLAFASQILRLFVPLQGRLHVSTQLLPRLFVAHMAQLLGSRVSEIEDETKGKQLTQLTGSPTITKALHIHTHGATRSATLCCIGTDLDDNDAQLQKLVCELALFLRTHDKGFLTVLHCPLFPCANTPTCNCSVLMVSALVPACVYLPTTASLCNCAQCS